MPYTMHQHARDGSPKWGYVDMCPCCPTYNIARQSPNQRTCGRQWCKTQIQLTWQRAKRARLARAPRLEQISSPVPAEGY